MNTKQRKGRVAQVTGRIEQAKNTLTPKTVAPARRNKKSAATPPATPAVPVPPTSRTKASTVTLSTPRTSVLGPSTKSASAGSGLKPHQPLSTPDTTPAAISTLTPPAASSRAKSKGPAKVVMSSNDRLPAPIEQRDSAIYGVTPTHRMPGRDDTSGGFAASVQGRGHDLLDTHNPAASATCLQLREHQSERRTLVTAMGRLRLQQLSLVRRALGWSLDLPEKERSRIAKLAQAAVKIMVKGALHRDPAVEMALGHCQLTVLSLDASMKPLAERRADVEKAMTKAAASLPLNEFVDGINGFGYFGLSIILGEAGDLGLYANPGKLWKRMGLAVFHGKSQRKTTDAEDAKLQGYNPVRRSAVWTLGDSLLKAKNVYKTLYDERKTYLMSDAHKAVATVEIKTKMHAHRQAQRYAEKRLLKDLWKAWRKAFGLSDAGGYEQNNAGGHLLFGTQPKNVAGIAHDSGHAALDTQDARAAVVQNNAGDPLTSGTHRPRVAGIAHDSDHTSPDTQDQGVAVASKRGRTLKGAAAA